MFLKRFLHISDPTCQEEQVNIQVSFKFANKFKASYMFKARDLFDFQCTIKPWQ